MECEECGKEMRPVKVRIEGAQQNVQSYQCPGCDRVEFEPETSKKVVAEVNCGITLKPSNIKGKGVFAARDFKKGDIVIVWHPKAVLSKMDFQSLSEDEKTHATYAGNGEYLVQGSPERFINHSCEPNTYTHERKDIALKDIKKGEEITGDYSLNGVEDWTMECTCGSKNCRKIIYGDFMKLDDKTRKRLEPYLEDWYREEFNSIK